MDNQARADALADAETAILNDPVQAYVTQGDRGSYMLEHLDDAPAAGYWLAHDAFRACPGLRGEEK